MISICMNCPSRIHRQILQLFDQLHILRADLQIGIYADGQEDSYIERNGDHDGISESGIHFTNDKSME